MDHDNPVTKALEADERNIIDGSMVRSGPIRSIEKSYRPDSNSLLGFVLDMSYDEAKIVTCDAWKQKCGGVPKNSFVVIRLNATSAALSTRLPLPPSLILARILEAVPTPLSSDIQETIFSIHKVQAVVDPYTNAELQWGALKASILGTFYDDGPSILFGNDIDSYLSPHFYEVYVPLRQDLETLINSFVSADKRRPIGYLRYTETQTLPTQPKVEITVSPLDFICNRTALFGKTRMGKSNTIKVIADLILKSKENVGQVIFDLNGEYSNYNEQDKTSLFDLHRDNCVRYSLNPYARSIEGVPNPFTLKVNFYSQIVLGHKIITSLFDTELRQKPPGYLVPFMEWDPCDLDVVQNVFANKGDETRYLRAVSMYFAALSSAGYRQNRNIVIDLHIHKELRTELGRNAIVRGVAELAQSATDQNPEIMSKQSLPAAVRIYGQLFLLYQGRSTDATLFPTSSRTGDPYFNPIHVALLRILGDSSITGTRYLMPFSKYHDQEGSNIARDIVSYVNDGKTVIIDLANADEVITRYYSGLICQEIFGSQTAKFTSGKLGNHSVLFYFEEAHNLFRKDDTDLQSIYNKLAKEGAKNRIGMVYATQSMTTLSPDLLKNTENFFIAHLNDDREIRELTNKYEFKEIGLDVQRCKTQGYVRMITLSHRFAIPVQINKFMASGVG